MTKISEYIYVKILIHISYLLQILSTKQGKKSKKSFKILFSKYGYVNIIFWTKLLNFPWGHVGPIGLAVFKLRIQTKRQTSKAYIQIQFLIFNKIHFDSLCHFICIQSLHNCAVCHEKIIKILLFQFFCKLSFYVYVSKLKKT